MNGHTREGRAVWLGEVMALMPLGSDDAKIALLPVEKRDEHPPIPVHFTLREPGFVTLVIDDAQGNRVRNLLSEEPFPPPAKTRRGGMARTTSVATVMPLVTASITSPRNWSLPAATRCGGSRIALLICATR
ncbi:MAG: hypothetical protein WDN28_24980 [Chthoniobacter sp.]